MAEPFHRIGEQRGPFVVTESKFEILPSGRTVEYVRDSGGNCATTFGWDDDREYYQVCQREGSILVPYTIRHKKTEDGLPSHATWQYVGNSNYDYWRVLVEWWTREFVVIEHDVQANPAIFQDFEDCPEPWCTFKYSNHSEANADAWKYGILGCTRFRTELIQGVPHALREMEWRYRDWHVLSTGLGKTLREAGFEPHVHGVVDHHRMMDLGGVAVLMAS